jgi:hypothetical protein
MNRAEVMRWCNGTHVGAHSGCQSRAEWTGASWPTARGHRRDPQRHRPPAASDAVDAQAGRAVPTGRRHRLPPLLLDGDEAVALTVGSHRHVVHGIDEIGTGVGKLSTLPTGSAQGRSTNDAVSQIRRTPIRTSKISGRPGGLAASRRRAPIEGCPRLSGHPLRSRGASVDQLATSWF